MQKLSPRLNLLVIRSPDIHRAVKFYEELGMTFDLHAHGKGPEHYAGEIDGLVFEIYPQRNEQDTTTSTRFGFRVQNVDEVVEKLTKLAATILTLPEDTEWGRRAVVQDFDGHTMELVNS